MIRTLEKAAYNLYRARLRRSTPVPALPGISEVEPRRRMKVSPLRRKVAAVVVAGLIAGAGWGGFEYAQHLEHREDMAAYSEASDDAEAARATYEAAHITELEGRGLEVPEDGIERFEFLLNHPPESETVEKLRERAEREGAKSAALVRQVFDD